MKGREASVKRPRDRYMEISSPKQKEGFLKIEKRIKVERGRSDKGVRALETGDLEREKRCGREDDGRRGKATHFFKLMKNTKPHIRNREGPQAGSTRGNRETPDTLPRGRRRGTPRFPAAQTDS